jgi:hypothetical protein
MRPGVLRRLQRGEDFQDLGFVNRAMAEVGIDGRSKAIAVFQQQPAHGIQMRPTLALGWIRLATEGIALQLEDVVEVGDLHLLASTASLSCGHGLRCPIRKISPCCL